jgi:Flp pilus assembly protein TadD
MDYQSIDEKGQERFSEGRVNYAEAVFNYVLEVQQNNTSVLNNLGVCAFTRDESTTA